MRFRLIPLLCLFSSFLLAQDVTVYKSKPKGHEKNQQQATNAYEANLKKYNGDTNVLVLPGVVAYRDRQRVEVMVESTRLESGAPCEFTVIAETSDHGYEANLISFAKPSDVHRAIQFIGTEPGESFDPDSLRFWAKGESFVLTIVQTNGSSFRLEKLVADKRNGKAPPDTGFMFTGSRMVDAPNGSNTLVYAADEYQPKSVVSLFNTPYSVLEVPYAARKDDVYQNMVVGPGYPLAEGTFLTLVIEPLNKGGGPRVRDIVLQVEAGTIPTNMTLTGMQRLSVMVCQLKDATNVLNATPSLLSVFDKLAKLDRKTYDYYLAVRIGDNVELRDVRSLGTVLSTIDSDRGVRIEPPPSGQLHYKAFNPDQQLLDRSTRIYHPWELSLTAKDGQVSGTLLLVDAVWKTGSSASELAYTEMPVSGPQDFRKELDADVERAKKAGTRPRPSVIMVFAPPTLTYGQLMKFLTPALPTHTAIHVYLDTPMPPVPKKNP